MFDLINPRQWVKNRPFQNFLSLAFIQGTNMLVALMITPLVFEAVGADNYGLINLALSIMMLLNVLVSYGYHLSGPRAVALKADDRPGLSALFSKIMLGKGAISILVLTLLAIAVYMGGFFGHYRNILLFSGTLLLAEAIYPLWLMQGMERMKMLSVGNLLSKVLYVILLILLVKEASHAYRVNFLMGASAFLVNALLVAYAIRRWGFRCRFPGFRGIIRSWRDNFYLFLSSVAGHISVHSGVIILSNFTTDYVLGVYSLAQKVAFLLRMLPVLVTQSILPGASRLFRDDRESFHFFLKKAYGLTLGATLLLSLTVYFLSLPIIDFLSAGTNTDAVYLLRILAFIPLLSSLNVANMIIVLASDSRKLLFKSTWISTVLMLIFSLYGAYQYAAEGLAFALLMAELATFLVQFFINLKSLRSVTRRFYSGLIA